MNKYVITPGLIKMAQKNSVIIHNTLVSKDNASMNAGIIIAENKILTALHCVGGKTIIIKDKEKYTPRDTDTFLTHAEVAVLTVNKPVFHKPDLRITTNVKPGEFLFWAAPFDQHRETTFCGYLTGITNLDDDITYYLIDGNVVQGMSGSGVYNHKGALVGMTKGSQTLHQRNIGIVLPVTYLLPLIYSYREDLREKTK